MKDSPAFWSAGTCYRLLFVALVVAAEPRPDAVVFCGDVVDYGPQPVECLRWLTENADHAVRGNHDNAVAFDADFRCTGTFRAYSVATRAWRGI